MPNYTNAEKTRLRNAILEVAYPIALKHRLSPTQLEDIVGRVLATNKVFLTADDRLTGYEVEFLIDDLRSDQKNAHLFRPVDETQKAKEGSFEARFGMSKDDFEKLSSRQKLDLANQEAARKAKGRN